jgi:ssDNA-binding Zn-finger/Zn-ribbon topoisomerase 1
MTIVSAADGLRTTAGDALNTSIAREHTKLTCPKCGHSGELLHAAGDDTHMHDTVTNFIQLPFSGIPHHQILICPKCNTALDPQGRVHARRSSDA